MVSRTDGRRSKNTPSPGHLQQDKPPQVYGYLSIIENTTLLMSSLNSHVYWDTPVSPLNYKACFLNTNYLHNVFIFQREGKPPILCNKYCFRQYFCIVVCYTIYIRKKYNVLGLQYKITFKPFRLGQWVKDCLSILSVFCGTTDVIQQNK